MLPSVLLLEAAQRSVRRILWFVDNTAALGSVIRGTSAQPVLEKLVALHWMLAYHLRVEVWLGFANSDSNWSDGISRLYRDDPLAREYGFVMAAFHPGHTWLRLDPE